jgi:hypothetical protein
MKNYLLLLLILLGSCDGLGQKMLYDPNTKLELKILDNELLLSPGDEWLMINVSITNKSNASFLLYDFKVIEPGRTPIESAMQPNWTVMNGIFALRDTVRLSIFSMQPLPGVGLLQSLDTLIHIKDLMEKHGARIQEEVLLLRNNETWSGKLRALVNKKRLLNQRYYEEKEKIKIEGEYEAFLIYSCGKNITNLIDEEKILEDEKVNNAILFQGYVRSNSVKLTITNN